MTGTDEELLRAHFPALAQRIRQRLAGANGKGATFSIERAATGDPSLRVNGILAHSIRDPRREARKLAETFRGDGPLVILGLGLGYVAEAAIELDQDRPIIIVERDLDSLALAFRERDLSFLIIREGTVFVVGGPPDGVLAALDAFNGIAKVVSNRAIRALDEAWFDAVESAVHTWTAKDEINAATLKRFAKRWVRNLAANLDSIRDLPGVARLAGCATGLPTLIIAAGPSLDEVLPFLPALSRRCIIIAVDTALRAITAAGVEPDFVLVVDPQFWNARHLDHCSAPRSVLISESTVYPSVLRSTERPAFGRAFLCASFFPLGRFIEDRVDAKGELGAGGSVATTAWDFARVLGASPLWVAGLDLSFPDLKTHFRGALFEERTHGESRRFAPAELRSFHALRDGQPFRAEDASGGRVLTDKRLSLYAAWFESRFRRHTEARPRSLSAHGLRISGMDPCSVEEILALGDRRAEIDGRLAASLSAAESTYNEEGERAERALRYEVAVTELVSGLAEITTVARDAVAECVSALASFDKGAEVSATLEALEAANAAITTSSVKDVAGFLFPPLSELEAELGSAGEDKLRRHLALSKRLYERLAESADYHARILLPRAKKR